MAKEHTRTPVPLTHNEDTLLGVLGGIYNKLMPGL